MLLIASGISLIIDANHNRFGVLIDYGAGSIPAARNWAINFSDR